MVSFPPRRCFVALATEFVKAFAAEHTDDAETIARVQLAAHELVENVVKYSSGGSCMVQVRMVPASRATASPATLLITTANEVAHGSLEAVDAYLERLERAHDPDLFYDERIAETAKRTDGSGLGLARIRSEALMDISHQVANGQLLVNVVATLPATRRELSP